MLSREWRCSWSSADRRCSNYIWIIDNFIAYYGAPYIRGFTLIQYHHCQCLGSLSGCVTRSPVKYIGACIVSTVGIDVTPLKYIISLCAKFFNRNIKFFIISPQWHGTGGWDLSSHKTRTYLVYIVNIITADLLATQGAPCKEPGHQQPWYWPSCTRINWSPHVKG